MKLTGNTVFIAGATSGIGLGLALRLHAAGNRVIVSGRRTDKLSQVVEANPGVEAVVLDTTDPVAIQDVTVQLLQRFPDLNVLVAMAGIMLPEDLHHGDFLTTAEATITTNLLGPIRLVAALTEHLATQPQATIMTVSSGLAFVPLPITPTYNATKAAIHSFTESLRVQLSDTGIDVLELVPPAVRTALMGQEEADNAMPLDAYLDEVMNILGSNEQPNEILVKAVEPLRFAEARGQHASVLHMLSSHRCLPSLMPGSCLLVPLRTRHVHELGHRRLVGIGNLSARQLTGAGHTVHARHAQPDGRKRRRAAETTRHGNTTRPRFPRRR